jgi:hypothetical protein
MYIPVICGDVCSGGRHVDGVIQYVTAHHEYRAFFIFFVRFVVTNNFFICDFSVLWYVFEFYKETCVCSWNVVDALEKAACLVAEASFSQGLKVWVLHKGHVLHFLPSHWMYD